MSRFKENFFDQTHQDFLPVLEEDVVIEESQASSHASSVKQAVSSHLKYFLKKNYPSVKSYSFEVYELR